MTAPMTVVSILVLAKPLRGDEGVHAQHQQHEHRAQNVDAAVTQRIGQGGVTGAKEPQ